jgi:hypothetical protein
VNNVTLEDGFLVYQKTFTALQRKKSPVVGWQLGADGKRSVEHVILAYYNSESRTLRFTLTDAKKLPFNEGIVYFWVEEEKLIFKSPLLKDGLVAVPSELKFLDGPDLQVLKGGNASGEGKLLAVVGGRSSRDRETLTASITAMTPEDEDKMYGSIREAPRRRATGDRKIRLHVLHDEAAAATYNLFDLSRGGLAFVCSVESAFQRGQIVHVIEVEASKLDDPLAGEVMSVRPLDEGGFKVGIKFVDEI